MENVDMEKTKMRALELATRTKDTKELVTRSLSSLRMYLVTMPLLFQIMADDKFLDLKNSDPETYYKTKSDVRGLVDQLTKTSAELEKILDKLA